MNKKTILLFPLFFSLIFWFSCKNSANNYNIDDNSNSSSSNSSSSISSLNSSSSSAVSSSSSSSSSAVSSSSSSSSSTISSSSSSSTGSPYKLSLCGVTDSTNDGNISSNTIDNDINSRWSADGDGQWISYNLCSVQNLGSIKIAWYLGDQRTSSFNIEVSDDAISWSNIFTGQSTGNSTSLEQYDFVDINARYLRIIGHGNSVNTWNSITEVEIWSSDGTGSFGITAPSEIIINSTGFEGYSDESVFSQSDWGSEGFNSLWVNGFDQDRAHIDTGYAKNGLASLRIDYPAGTFGPGDNGAQTPLSFNTESEVYISYWVRFSDNFDWGGTSEGGKLPGLASGLNCSGGDTCNGTNGFSARLMWRTGGEIILYLYHMDKPDTYGENFALNGGSGNTYFAKGTWYHIVERVKINSGNNNDGEIDIWIDNLKVLSMNDIRYVNDGSGVDNLYFSTFHGGGDINWAPSVDCYIYFDDIKIYK